MSADNTVLMRVDTIVIDPASEMPVLILRGRDEPKLYLPIFIGQLEAASIASVIAGVSLPRPMTHDLMIRLLDSLQAEILEVVIARLQENTFYAELRVIDATQELRVIDARPSDSIALAIRCGAPIRVAESVLTEAGGLAEVDATTEDPQSEVEVEESCAPTFAADDDVRLEDIDPDVFGKYKM